MDQLRPGETLVLWRLDRLGRSLRHLVDSINGLADAAWGSTAGMKQSTSSPGGKLAFHMFAAPAKFERKHIRQCTRAGPVPARAHLP
jgi:DNA invertase Pin-like site-specific DNA recombinase